MPPSHTALDPVAADLHHDTRPVTFPDVAEAEQLEGLLSKSTNSVISLEKLQGQT